MVPVRFAFISDDLQTRVLRGVGFRATAGDTWQGPVRKSRSAARADAVTYNRVQSGAS